ncbi:hypothetical protein MRX96_027186 [Rhipicephalus microplus]
MLNSTVAALFTRTPWRETTPALDSRKSVRSSSMTLSNVVHAYIYESNSDTQALKPHDHKHCDTNSLSFCNGTMALETSLHCSDCAKTRECEAPLNTVESPPRKKTVPRNTLAKWLVFLKNPKFYVVAYSLGQIWYLNTTLLTVVVDYAVECGVPKWNAVSLVTFITVPDLVCRFVSGPITDKGLLRKSTMMALCLTANGIAHSLLPLFASYHALAVLSAAAGTCNGIAVTHIFVLCGELVDPAVFSLCLGAANFVAAFALLERPLMIGYCRDKLGSYDGLFYFSASVAWSSAILWLIVYLHERRTTGAKLLSNATSR